MYFRRPIPNLSNVLLNIESITPPKFKRKNTKLTAAQKSGIKYERERKARLADLYGNKFIASPWFKYSFRDNRGYVIENICQPDGILFHPNKNELIIIEIKLMHCADAFYQLFELYLPIIKFYYPSYDSYSTLEIVKFYDCALLMPAKVILSRDELNLTPEQFCVKIWTK